LNLKWIEQDKNAVLSIDKDVLYTEETLKKISDMGFDALLTVEDYDFSIIWRVSEEIPLRHYCFGLSDFPEMTRWDENKIIEFINYENAYNRKVLMWSADLDLYETIMNFSVDLFESEVIEMPDILTHCTACTEKGCHTDLFCHTSSVEDAIKIMESGQLLSASISRNVDTKTLTEEGRNAAGDPEDYFDYVMLSYGNCIAGDRLVNERRLGRMPSEEDLDQGFVPGVRFFFDAEDVLYHPSYTPDGYHPCKVKDAIDLEKYLLVGIASKDSEEELRMHLRESLVDKIEFVDNEDAKGIFNWTHKAYTIALKHKSN